MNKRIGPVKTVIRDWVALNTNELSWIVLLTGVALLIGVFMAP